MTLVSVVCLMSVCYPVTLLGLITPGPYWRNFSFIGEIKAGGKEAGGKGVKHFYFVFVKFK